MIIVKTKKLMALSSKINVILLRLLIFAIVAFFAIKLIYPYQQTRLKDRYRIFYNFGGEFEVLDVTFSRSFSKIKLVDGNTYWYQTKELEKERRIRKGDILFKITKELSFKITKQNGESFIVKMNNID